MNNIKALSGIMASLMLLGVAIGGFVFFGSWYNFYYKDVITTYTNDASDVDMDFLDINSSALILRSYSQENKTFTNIKIDSVLCNISGSINSSSINLIDISSCTSSLSTGIKDVVIYGNNGLVQSKLPYS